MASLADVESLASPGAGSSQRVLAGLSSTSSGWGVNDNKTSELKKAWLVDLSVLSA